MSSIKLLIDKLDSEHELFSDPDIQPVESINTGTSTVDLLLTRFIIHLVKIQ